MAKIVKTLTVSWQWSGDKYSLRGFNLAVTPAAKNPKEEVVATAFVETKEIKQTYSYKMGNVTLDKDAQYKIWVQAVYENSDSDWVATGGATVSDDGSATIITKTDREIQDVVNMASDNILTRQEKISLRREWQEIVYEFLEIESTAISQDIPSSNAAFSNFKSKGNALGTYLNGGTEWTISSNNKTSFPLWINDSNLGSNTSINGNTYRETFRVYYEAKVKILEEINKYKVNNVQVGGVNLLVGTATSKNTNVNVPTSFTTWDPYTTHNKQTLEQLGFKAGDKITVGFDWSISKNGTNDYVYGNFRVEFRGITSDGTDNQYLGAIKNPADTFSSSNTKGRVEATVALDSTTIKAHSLRFRIDNSVLNFKVSNLKMERGTKATGWSPALEEMENAYTVILTNEAQVIPTNSNRVPTSSTTYFTDIQVYKGTTQRNDYTIGTVNSANGITVSKISSRVNFAVSTNTALAADGGNFVIPITIDGKTFNKTFSWSCSKQGNTGATGASGVGISKIIEYYAVSSSNTTEPTSWSTTVPAMTATDKYLWNYETITYSNNTTTNTSKRVIGVYGDKGNTGATGATGNGISNIVNYYLATSSSSGVTTSTSGWTTSVQAVSASKKYLWNYEVITYTNGSTSTTTPCIIGAYGDTGATGATGPAGQDAITIVLSNENHTFPCESDGNIPTALSTTCVVTAYKGGTSVTPTIGSITNPTGMTISKNGATLTIQANTGTSLADSGAVNIPITVDDKTFNKTFTWSKAKKGATGATGATGAGAKTADIIASSQVFKSTDGGKTFLPDTITLTPSLQNVTFSKWQYSTDGGRSWSNVSSGSNGLSVSGNNLQISKSSNLFTSTNTTVVFKVITNDSAIYDTMTIVKLYDVTELEVGGRNYIRNGKGDKKAGFFKNFNNVTGGYGELTLTSQKTYDNISIADGFVLGCRDYEVGRKMVFSYDIMYTKWDFPSGTNRAEFWIGQRYTNSSTSADGQWRGVTQHNLPVVGENGCKLNEWYHVSKIITIPEQAEATIGTASSIQFYNSNADVSASFTARFKNVKLEYGSMETDWTPAPEDVATDIDNAKNEAIDSANNTLTTTITNYYTKEETNSQIDVAKEAINLGVSSTYETKANVETKVSSTLNSAKSYADTKKTEAINSAASDATNKVNSAKNELNTKIDGIQVGGRNLLRNSQNYSNWLGENGTTVSTIDNSNEPTKILQVTTNGGAGGHVKINVSNYIRGKEYILSFYAKNISGDKTIKFEPHGGPVYSVTSTSEWGQYKVKIIPNENWSSTVPYFYFNNKNNTSVFQIKNVKLEEGNKATDWTPAPEDVDSNISNAKNEAINSANNTLTNTIANYYTREETNSQINVAKDAINLGVSQTYETKANVETKVSTTLNSAKSYADTKKTEAINSAASDATSKVNSAKNELNTKIDSIQVGGRNLALGTGKAAGDVSGGNSGSPYSATDLFNGITAIKTNTAWSGRLFNLKAIARRGGFKVGDNLILSVYIKSDQNVTLNITSHRTTGTGNTPGSNKSYNNFTVTPKWQQVWFPFVADEGSLNREDARIEVNAATNSNYIHWAGWKLERGTKPSDWTPAPEDIDSNLDDVKNSLNSFQNTVNTTFKDGIVEEAEAKAIAQHLKTLDAEKADIDKEYSTIYGNSLLGGTAKTNLANAKTSFDSAHTSLKSTINTVISDGRVSLSESASVASTFGTYNTQLGAYKQRVQEALDAISSAKVDNVQVGGANLWSETAWIDGAIMADGSVSDYWTRPHVSYPDFVSVGNNKYITYQCWNPNGVFNDSNYNRIVFYDLNKVVLGSVDVPVLNGEAYQCKTWEILNGTKYIRFGVISDVSGGGYNTSLKFKFEFGNKPTEWSPNALDITNNITTAKNEAINSANNTLNSTIANYYTKEQTNSQINIAKEAINLGVSQTYETKAEVTNKINNIQVGGTNLWVISDLVDGWESGGVIVGEGSQHKTRQTLITTNGARQLIYQCWNPNRIVNTENANRVAFYDADRNYITWAGVAQLTGEAYQHQLIDIPANAVYMRLGALCGANGVGYDSSIKIKFELGNKATDWTPAPEDVDSNISNAKNEAINSANNTLTTTIANYYTKSQTDSAINVAKEEINLGVSTKYETKLEVDNKINAIEVGGTNFMRNSSFQNEHNAVKHWGGNGGDFRSINVPSALSGKGIEIGGTNYQGLYQCPINNEIGVYTISFYLRTDSANPLIMFSRWEGFCNEQLFTATNSWTRCSYVVNKTRTDANAIVFYLYHGTDYNKIQIHSVQVERGNKATDWSPSPFDTVSDIADAKNDAINTASTDAANKVNSAKNELNTKIDNIQVGGRNLWRFTKEYDGTKYSGWVDNNDSYPQAIAPYTTVNGFGVQRIAGTWTDISQRATIEANTDYTLSAWIKWESTAGSMMFYTNTGTMSGTDVTSQVGTTDYKRVSITFNSGNATVSTCRFECNSNTPYLIYGLKLEKGTKATDWTPAPEDIDSAIDKKANSADVYTKTEVYTKNETDSQINIAKDSITSSVSSLRTDIMSTSFTNLLLNSDFQYYQNGVNMPTHYDSNNLQYCYGGGWLCPEGGKTIHINSVGSGINWLGWLSHSIKASKDQVMTASVYVATDNLNSFNAGLGLEIEWLNSNYERITCSGLYFNIQNSHTWERKSITGTAPEGTAYVRIFCWNHAEGISWWGKPMLQMGSVCTAWDKGGSIDVVEQRLSSAEQKITDSAIISTVTSSTTYRNDLTGKVDTNKIISTINQTAEAIKISANKIQLEGAVTADMITSGTFKGVNFEAGGSGNTGSVLVKDANNNNLFSASKNGVNTKKITFVDTVNNDGTFVSSANTVMTSTGYIYSFSESSSSFSATDLFSFNGTRLSAESGIRRTDGSSTVSKTTLTPGGIELSKISNDKDSTTARTAISNSGITIDRNGKNMVIGTGDADVYIHNSASGRYLQLRDNGNLDYDNNSVFHNGNCTTSADSICRTWRYPNGMQISIVKVYGTWNVNTAWGSVYSSPWISGQSFNIAFSEAPKVTINAYNADSSIMVVQCSGPTTTATGACYLWKPTSQTGIKTWIEYIAIGRWK